MEVDIFFNRIFREGGNYMLVGMEGIMQRI